MTNHLQLLKNVSKSEVFVVKLHP